MAVQPSGTQGRPMERGSQIGLRLGHSQHFRLLIVRCVSTSTSVAQGSVSVSGLQGRTCSMCLRPHTLPKLHQLTNSKTKVFFSTTTMCSRAVAVSMRGHQSTRLLSHLCSVMMRTQGFRVGVAPGAHQDVLFSYRYACCMFCAVCAWLRCGVAKICPSNHIIQSHHCVNIF